MPRPKHLAAQHSSNGKQIASRQGAPDRITVALCAVPHSCAAELAQQVSIEVCWACLRMSEIADMAAESTPDVFLVNLDTQRWSLAHCCQQLRSVAALAKVLVMTERSDAELISGFLRCGAHGVSHPGASTAQLVKAVRTVRNGEIWLQRRLMAEILLHLLRQLDFSNGTAGTLDGARSTGHSLLTPRESEVARLLMKGLSNKQIADDLAVSVETVKKHLKSIFVKLNVQRRTQVALKKA